MRISQRGRALLNEFKNFAVKGSVVDMAAGVIIGTAFSKIVSSLVDDVLMPCLSLIVGSINIKELSLTLRPAADGENAVVLHWGAFVQSVIDFTLIAWCIFIALKILLRLKKAMEFTEDSSDTPEAEQQTAATAEKSGELPQKDNAEAAAATADAREREVELLSEIRDLLKQRSGGN